MYVWRIWMKCVPNVALGRDLLVSFRLRFPVLQNKCHGLMSVKYYKKKGYLRELKTITNWTWDIHRRVWLLGYFIPIVFFPRSLIWTDTRPAGKTATEANISVTYYLSIFDFLLVCDLLLIYRHLLFVSINLIPYWSLIQFFAPEFL